MLEENQKQQYKVLKDWLRSNEDLKDTGEYAQKAKQLIELNSVGSYSPKQEQQWLKENKDKKGTVEYDERAVRFLEAVQNKDDPINAANASRRGLIQGATFEFADEIVSAGKAAVEYLTDNPLDRDYSEIYRDKKNKEDALLNAYKEEYPNLYLGSQITGSLATLPLGVAGRGAQGVSKALPFLFGGGRSTGTVLGTAASASKAGALQGGLTSAGLAREDAVLRDSAYGFLIGGGFSFGLSALGTKVADQIYNSQKGLVVRANESLKGVQPSPSNTLAGDVQVRASNLANAAKATRDARYSNWRNQLENTIEASGIKVSRDTLTKTQAPEVIPTAQLKSLLKPFKDSKDIPADAKKAINNLLNSKQKVTFEGYKDLVSRSYDLASSLPNQYKVSLTDKLTKNKDFAYSWLDNNLPNSLGTKAKRIDKLTRLYETGDQLSKNIVSKLRNGEPLNPQFAQSLLPGSKVNLDKFNKFSTSVSKWAKESNLPKQTVDELYLPLQANAINDAVNNPKLLTALSERKTTAQLDIVEHYKKLLTPEQFSFLNSISTKQTNHLARRFRSLADYYAASGAMSGAAALLSGGGAALAGASSSVALGAAGVAVVAGVLAGPVATRKIASSPKMLRLMNRLVSASPDVPQNKMASYAESLGVAAIKEGFITPSQALLFLENRARIEREGEEDQQVPTQGQMRSTQQPTTGGM